MRAAALAAVVVAGTACGDGGAPGGGFEHLPTLGAGPYEKLSLRVIYDLTADLGDPATLDTPEGLRFWFTRTERGAVTSEIWTALVTSIEASTTDLAPALAADQAWEEGSVRAPSLATLPDGRLALYYQGATAIGRAISGDGGRTWHKDPGPILEDATDPAVLILDGEVLVYHGRPDRPGIFREGATEPVVAGAIEPGVVGGRTAAGQVHIGLFYVQPPVEPGPLAIGYAGSFDGLRFVPFGGGAPVLDPPAPEERAPEAHIHADEGFLFFAEPNGATRAIDGAHHP